MSTSSPKLPLTDAEKAQLRACKIKLADMATMRPLEIADCLEIPLERAQRLRGLAEFQGVPSIGPRVAERVVHMGYYTLEDLRGEDGADLINRWEQLNGYWEDPCLEDAFRCIVHHANHPGDSKSWFDFTEARKTYRQQYGYPDARPKLPWHEARARNGASRD